MDSTNAMLTCELELMAISGGEIGLAFKVSNPGQQPVTVKYFKPFIGFDLSVWAGDEPVRVTQPAYDVPVQPQNVTIAPGETIQIETPIRLRFAQVEGGIEAASRPTVWTLEHALTPLRMRVLLHLDGASVAPCTALYDPTTQSGNGSRPVSGRNLLALAVAVAIIIAVVIAIALATQARAQNGQAASGMLTCELEAAPQSDWTIGLAFTVRNPGNQAVTVSYFKPYIDFDLAASVGNEVVRLDKPAYDAPAQPQSLTLAPGASVRLDTPIGLRFAPDGDSPAASDPNVWVMKYKPAALHLRATPRLSGAAVSSCEADLGPPSTTSFTDQSK